MRNDKLTIFYFTELSELTIGNDHEVAAAKELKDNYIKVESSVVCHDGESIQVCIYKIFMSTINYTNKYVNIC